MGNPEWVAMGSALGFNKPQRIGYGAAGFPSRPIR